VSFNVSYIEPLKSLFFGIETNIDILRDDLIHPIVSGNKWRKLKYIVDDFKSSDKEVLVTFGGAYSNHLIATAFAGKLFGFRTFGFVRGDEERPNNHYEILCLENDMELKHVSRNDYINKQQLFDKFFDKQKAYFVDEGGNHPLALKGCEEIVDSFKKEYDYVVLSIGTGTTMEGIVKAIKKKQLKTKVLGISSLKNNFYLDERMQKYPIDSWHIFHNFHRGKYAKMDQELLQFIQDFYLETSIKTDPIYTGKMLLAVKDLYHQKILNLNDNVLVIHTGGIMSFDQN
jgi:1-aminocyclopropane-1-carboxylate deaminase